MYFLHKMKPKLETPFIGLLEQIGALLFRLRKGEMCVSIVDFFDYSINILTFKECKTMGGGTVYVLQ